MVFDCYILEVCLLLEYIIWATPFEVFITQGFFGKLSALRLIILKDIEVFLNLRCLGTCLQSVTLGATYNLLQTNF